MISSKNVVFFQIAEYVRYHAIFMMVVCYVFCSVLGYIYVIMGSADIFNGFKKSDEVELLYYLFIIGCRIHQSCIKHLPTIFNHIVIY